VHGRERALVSRTRDRHAAVHELLQAGRSQREAAEILGLSRNAVNRFAREPDPAALLVKATSRESKLDPFKAYINQRWNDGITSAAALHAELAATQGWTGSVQAVERYVRQFRTADGRTRAGRNPGRPRHPGPSRRPARSPAGCCPARIASTPMTRPDLPSSQPAARTWTPWQATSAASPR
jgi:transposase